MNDLKIACPSCGGHISFPVDMHGQVIPCPHCSLSVPLIIPGYTQQPPPAPFPSAPAKKSKNIGCLATVLILGAALVLFFVIPALVLSDHDNSPSANDESGQAYYAAVKFCERYAPSAKNFTTESGGDYLDGKAEWVTTGGHSDWFANGFVDCQNKFGAMRHQQWGAHVILQDGKWQLKFLTIGDEDFVNEYDSP